MVLLELSIRYKSAHKSYEHFIPTRTSEYRTSYRRCDEWLESAVNSAVALTPLVQPSTLRLERVIPWTGITLPYTRH